MINECVIAHGIFDDKIILAKNRDRTYKASVRIVREIVKGVEMVYILDDDTDWSEGLNEHGIAIVNSALMVNADEKEKKLAKAKGKPSEDGAKIRRALSYKKPSEAIMSIVNYTGDDREDETGIKGHTFIATLKHTYSIEMTSEHKPVIKKLSKKETHVRTNHGYDYKDSGYTSGQNKKSSLLRHKRSQSILSKVDSPDGVLDGLSAIQAPDDMRNNPFRDNDEVNNKTKKDVLSTTGQILLNVTDLEFVYRVDKDQCDYNGIDDKTPEHYEPKIMIRVQSVKNKTIK
jgi:hypothetical protein